MLSSKLFGVSSSISYFQPAWEFCFLGIFWKRKRKKKKRRRQKAKVLQLCSCEKWNILIHKIPRFRNQESKLFKAPSILSKTRCGSHWFDQSLLPMLKFILQDPYLETDPLEEAKLGPDLKGQSRYGIAKWREMYLGVHFCSWRWVIWTLPLISRKASWGINIESQDSSVLHPLEARTQLIFTYCSISSRMVGGCFQETPRLKIGKCFSTCISSLPPIDCHKNLETVSPSSYSWGLGITDAEPHHPQHPRNFPNKFYILKFWKLLKNSKYKRVL